MTNYYDLIKVSKMSNYYDWINKAIQGTFFKSQKSKNRLKSHRFLFTCEKQWQIVKKKVKKGYMEIMDPYLLVT